MKGTRRQTHKPKTVIDGSGGKGAAQTELDTEKKKQMLTAKVTCLGKQPTVQTERCHRKPAGEKKKADKETMAVEGTQRKIKGRLGDKSIRPNRGRKNLTPNAKKVVAPEVEAAIEKFMNYVKEAGVEGLRKEFDLIKAYVPPDYTFETFTKNKEKNRFLDVVCLDATRVILKNDYGNYTNADDDYLNANWVKLEHVDRQFIAAQAPLVNTIEDFWRMIFQENVAVIVVVCKFIENGQAKCTEYWPQKGGEYKNYGKMFVDNKKLEVEDKFETYTLEVLPDGCSNSIVVKLIHCTSWPDHGVPNSGRIVLRMLKMIKECMPGPAVVHCSAGIGRTGTILAIEAVISRLFKGKETTVKDVFQQMRGCRASCIQTEAQYLFVYMTVLDYVKAKLPNKYAPMVTKFYHDLEKL